MENTSLLCRAPFHCPSCGAKRAAAFAAFLADEALEEVGHAMWTFSLPKMIRPYFVHHPDLQGRLCRAAYETAQEMMATPEIGREGFRTGMVAFAATAGDLLNVNPHVHAKPGRRPPERLLWEESSAFTVS